MRAGISPFDLSRHLGMDAVLQRAAVLDQVQPEAGPLPLGTHRRVGQPDLRDQVAAGELGQHEAVDLVCLAGKRRQPPRLGRIGDPHLPAVQLKLVVDETDAAHRLDHRQHRLRVAQSLDRPALTVVL